MIKAWSGSVIALIAFLALCTCIEPYYPKLKGYESLLVVDALITDANTSYTIKLSRTIQEQNGTSDMVSDATVYLTDDKQNNSYFKNHGGGFYKSDSLNFRTSVGRKYTLHILTGDGNEYESDQCLMQSVPDIDSVYYARDQDIENNGTESLIGARIYLDSKTGDADQYFRWSFVETWKFRLPTSKKYDYIDVKTIIPVTNIKQYCWKSRKSDAILIHPANSGSNEHFGKQPIFFIATDKSDRLMIKYSILVNQYSISKKEYDFWDNMKRTDESGSDIFASQPISVLSNIHNINDPKERVLGYFQVSALKQKRIFITVNALYRLNLTYYHYPECKRIEDGPEISKMKFDDIYTMYCINSDYSFIEPEYNPETGQLQFLVFARPECANCELTGTSIKPDFWIDPN
jgi:hypothetical protein